MVVFPKQSLRERRPGGIEHEVTIVLYLYLIYLRIPQQGSNPDRGGLLSSYKRK